MQLGAGRVTRRIHGHHHRHPGQPPLARGPRLCPRPHRGTDEKRPEIPRAALRRPDDLSADRDRVQRRRRHLGSRARESLAARARRDAAWRGHSAVDLSAAALRRETSGRGCRRDRHALWLGQRGHLHRRDELSPVHRPALRELRHRISRRHGIPGDPRRRRAGKARHEESGRSVRRIRRRPRATTPSSRTSSSGRASTASR